MSNDIVNRMKRTLASHKSKASPVKEEKPSRGLLGRRPVMDATPQEEDQLMKIANYIEEIRKHKEAVKNG